MHRDLHSFPTRRSSDLAGDAVLPAALPEVFREIASHCLQPEPQRRWTVTQISARLAGRAVAPIVFPAKVEAAAGPPRAAGKRDRKSTRLNSSHVEISYA